MARPNESTQPLYRPQYITFQSAEKQSRIVEVLANEAAATASGGYPLWTRLKRPQRLSLTILEGYEPFILTVPILFDAVRRAGTRENVEEQIQWLEWMANRGDKRHGKFKPAIGKPPLVKVYASSSIERYSPLIPKQFQEPGLDWFIEDITWDDHPLRDISGARIRQAALVRLVQYVKAESLESPKQGQESYTVHHTTKADNTLRKVVARWLVGTRLRLAEAVKATIEANRGNRAIGSHPDKKLKLKTPIRIPNRFLQP